MVDNPPADGHCSCLPPKQASRGFTQDSYHLPNQLAHFDEGVAAAKALLIEV